MGGMTQGGMNQGGYGFQSPNQQQTAANGVKATEGSSPSLGQMQQGMGGLLTQETSQSGFDTFMGGLMGQFAPVLNSLITQGYKGMGMEPPTDPVIPVAQQPAAPVVPPPKLPTAEDEEDDPDLPDWLNRYRRDGASGLVKTEKVQKAAKRAKKLASLLSPGI